MERSDASSVTTASDSADTARHNIWNPMTEILFHVQIGGIFELLVDKIDLARIALSFHFANDAQCDKAGAHDSV